jgi:hypothetical protein
VGALNEITEHLEANGLGPVVWSFHEAASDRCVGLFPYAGRRSVRVKGRKEPVSQWPRLQAVCRVPYRAGDELAAEALAREVYGLLDGVREEVIGGTRYQSIDALQEPFRDPAGRDDRGRIRYIVNFEIRKEPS